MISQSNNRTQNNIWRTPLPAENAWPAREISMRPCVMMDRWQTKLLEQFWNVHMLNFFYHDISNIAFQIRVHPPLCTASNHYGVSTMITVTVSPGLKPVNSALASVAEWWPLSRDKNSIVFWNGMTRVRIFDSKTCVLVHASIELDS